MKWYLKRVESGAVETFRTKKAAFAAQSEDLELHGRCTGVTKRKPT